MLMRLRCLGLDCKNKETCDRYLAAPTRVYPQDTMEPPEGECDKYWPHKPCPNPAPNNEGSTRAVRPKSGWILG